jgi:hypothetical protein
MTLLEDGGLILVVGTRTTNIADEWRQHPRVVCWDSTNATTARNDVPTNTRAIIYTRWVSHQLTDRLIKTARDRKLTLFPMSTTHQINDKIAEVLGVKVEKKGERPARGQLQTFILEHADFSRTPSTEAERLFALAREHGLATTPNSVEVALRRIRRTQRRTDAPPSVTLARPTGTAHVVAVLDDAIAGLQLVRETIEKLEVENRELNARLEAMKKVLTA